jgi:hypothetical protein
MSSHRRMIRRLRTLVLGLTALAALVPAGAAAVATDNSGQTRYDRAYIQGITAMTAEELAAAYGSGVDAQSKVGGTPADLPDATGAAPAEVVRGERTVVREVSAALPIALAGLALIIALAMTGLVVVRTRGAVGRLR